MQRNICILLIFVDSVFGVSWFDSTSRCPGLDNYEDFRDHAKRTLDPKAFRYIDSAAMLGTTKRNNRAAFNRLFFRPRFMVDVSSINLETTLLGSKVSVPFGISPAAAHQTAHPDGEIATVRAVSEMGNIMIVSCFATVSMEDVAANAGPDAVLWFQVHIFPNRTITQDLVRRAETLGYKAISVGIDFPTIGIRYISKKDSYFLPPGASYVNFQKYNSQGGFGDPGATWKDIKYLKSITNLPVIVKGVLTVEDAVLAVQHGVSGILISNHGGRQLDGSPATMEVLPSIANAIGGRAEIYLDSGIRTGLDVLKALALGAKAVFFGRPMLFALSFQGEVGGKCYMDILRNELTNGMMLTGTSDVKKPPRYLLSTNQYSQCPN